jgi:hypothetical protein
MSARRTVAARTTLRLVELTDLDEVGLFDPLDHQLRDAVTSRQHDRLVRIMVDEAYPDLAPIAGVDGPRRVHHRESRAGGQARPRMDEAGIPGRQRDGYPGADKGPRSGVEHDVGGGDEVGTGVALSGIGGEGDTGIDSGEEDLHSGHGRRDYPEVVSGSTGAAERRADDMAETGRTRAGARTWHVERLYVPWWGWPLPLIGGALLAAEIHMGYPGVRSWLPYLVMLPLVAAIIIALGRVKVEVADDGSGEHGPDGEPELRVGDAHVPVRHTGEIDVIDRERKRKALGPELDPAAFVTHRGWVGPLVRVRLTDPADPTPYWLISSRKPDALAAALRNSRGHDERDDQGE